LYSPERKSLTTSGDGVVGVVDLVLWQGAALADQLSIAGGETIEHCPLNGTRRASWMQLGTVESR
jgi:hypothetical protein